MPVYVRYTLIAIAACLLFMPFLGHVHLFDWDEINFAECAREMIVSKDYLRVQIDFMPFWEKPPLFIWLQVLAMKLFGINEYAARFPNAVVGVATLLTIFYAGKRVVNEKMGTWWAAIYAATWLPHFYFKSGIIDPTFNLFIFLSFFQVHLLKYADRKVLHALLGGLFLGLAVLTKGPVAILVAILAFSVYIIFNRGLKGFKIQHLLLLALAALVTTAIWFTIEVLNDGWKLVQDFIVYQIRLFKTEDAGHGGPFFYHFIILMIGCFPAAALSILSMRIGKRSNDTPNHFHLWMMLLFWATLLLFSIVKTKIVHYSSLCYFPLTYLATVSFYHLYRRKWNLPAWNKWLQFGTGLLLSLLIIAVTFIDQFKPYLLAPGRVKDQFAKANLNAQVEWSGWEKLPGAILLAGIIIFAIRANRNIRSALVALFLTALIGINLTIILITPKVEPYSQGAAIEFYESKQGETALVEPLRYKSYAHLFYTMRPPQFTRSLADSIKQFNSHPEIPVYYVGKIQNKEENQRDMPYLQLLYEKNGFVFYKRTNP